MEEEEKKKKFIQGLQFNQPVKEASQAKKLVPLVLGLVLVVVIIWGGLAVSRKALRSVRRAEPTPTPTPEVVTPTPALKREDLKIKVLNGSGEPGMAARAKALLEGLGYQEVAVGNADSFDYQETEIAIQDDKQEYLEMVMADLENDYTLSTESASLEESDFDVVVTLGAK